MGHRIYVLKTRLKILLNFFAHIGNAGTDNIDSNTSSAQVTIDLAPDTRFDRFAPIYCNNFLEIGKKSKRKEIKWDKRYQ